MKSKNFEPIIEGPRLSKIGGRVVSGVSDDVSSVNHGFHVDLGILTGVVVVSVVVVSCPSNSVQ